jgi:hypothetical protein
VAVNLANSSALRAQDPLLRVPRRHGRVRDTAYAEAKRCFERGYETLLPTLLHLISVRVFLLLYTSTKISITTTIPRERSLPEIAWEIVLVGAE